MIYHPGMLLNRAKDVLRTEGLLPLLRRGFDFLARPFFRYGTFYLYEYTVKGRSKAEFIPRLQNLIVHIVSTNQQADELAARGFDCRSCSVYARRRLDKGAIAVCVFFKQELASIIWVALTKEAKKSVDSLPYRVDFANKEACTGGAQTIPKYRRQGMMTYTYYRLFQFLREQGITTSRNAVGSSNFASQKAQAKVGRRIYARARYLRILWWQSWKETPLVPAGQHD
jgi:hypothetical protein